MTPSVLATLLMLRPFVDVAARVVPLPTLFARFPVVGDRRDVDDVVAAIRRVEGVWRRLPRGSGTCLTRSLWRVAAARRAGLPVRFVIGVRLSTTKQVEAHAWLELDGALFMEADPAVPPRFTPIFSDPSSSASSTVPADLRFV